MNMPVSFKNAGVPANVQDLAKALGNVSAGGEGASHFDGCELLRMDKNTGEWSFGVDGMELEPTEVVAVNPFSLEHGYISWSKKREVMGEAMVPVTQPAPDRSSLKDVGFDWDEQLLFKAQTLDGDGVSLLYKNTSMGGKDAIRSLAKSIVGQLGVTQEFIVPMITISNTSYEHKTYGTIYKPQFTIVGWMDLDGNELGDDKLLSDDSKSEEKPAPAQKSAKAKTKAKAETPATDGDDDGAPLEEEAVGEEPEQVQPPAKTTSRRKRRA